MNHSNTMHDPDNSMQDSDDDSDQDVEDYQRAERNHLDRLEENFDRSI